MRRPVCAEINPLIVQEAERVYAIAGMGEALRAAVRLAYAEGEKRYPQREPSEESRDVINALVAHNLQTVARSPTQGEAA